VHSEEQVSRTRRVLFDKTFRPVGFFCGALNNSKYMSLRYITFKRNALIGYRRLKVGE